MSHTSACCENPTAYLITYDTDVKSQISVCDKCINYETRSQAEPDRIIKPFQRNVLQMKCNSCGKDVTKALRCDTCHLTTEGEKK
jgi:hypothetical protein